MSKLIYCDTNVYMDYFLGRHDRFAPLDEIAAQIFKRAISCEFSIIISRLLLVELERYDLSEEMLRLTRALGKKTIYVEDDADDRELARRIPTHFDDALHIAIALRHGAETIVTNNLADFLCAHDLVRCVSPRFL
jgi:predicted nucleic acid-binding protein